MALQRSSTDALQQAVDAFQHRHLRDDTDRQSGELRRLCRLHASGFCLNDLQTLARVLVPAGEQAVRAPNVCKELIALLGLVGRHWRLQPSAKPNPDPDAPEPGDRASVLSALGYLVTLPSTSLQEASFLATRSLVEATTSVPSRQGQAERRATIAAVGPSGAPGMVLAKAQELDGAGSDEAWLVRCFDLLVTYGRVSASAMQSLAEAGAIQHMLRCVAAEASGERESTLLPKPHRRGRILRRQCASRLAARLTRRGWRI